MSAPDNMINGTFRLLTADDWNDYELIDSGHGRKLERYGSVKVNRPDPQALWPSYHPIDEWKAHGVFASGGQEEDEERGKWRLSNPTSPEEWPMHWQGLTAMARLAAFRHMGLFPEHSVHWRWAADKIENAGRPVRILNLFGYTGMMSLACAKAGAEVVHIDASPKSIGFGRTNQSLSNLDDRTIRWICEDAMKFLQREERRGRRYDGIVLDPPKFGRGPKKEVWQLSNQLEDLLSLTRSVLTDTPLFVIMTIYAVRLSYLSVGQALASHLNDLGGGLEWGEMTLRESARGLLLPTAVYARWSTDL